MFRRRRANGQRYFTRNVSGTIDKSFDNTSISGQFWPLSVVDGQILIPEDLAGVAASKLVKHVAISGWSWQDDVALYTQSNSDQQTFAVVGAVAYYVDAITSGGNPAHAGVGFLNEVGIAQATEMDDFPLRIVHRRRFTAMVNQYNAPPAGGFGGMAGEGFGLGALVGSAALTTAGWGTERHIRRRIRLRLNEGLFVRIEVYDVVTPGGTPADEFFHIQYDLLGALSFTVVT